MNRKHDSDHDGINHHERRISGFTKLVYAVFIVNVLAVLLLFVGVIAGWFRLDAGRIADGSFRVGMVVDSNEVGNDIGDTMNAASNLSETAKSATGLQTLDGKLESFDAVENILILTEKDQQHQIAVTNATEFDGDDLTGVPDLTPGQLLRVTVQTKNEQQFAVKVTQKDAERP